MATFPNVDAEQVCCVMRFGRPGPLYPAVMFAECGTSLLHHCWGFLIALPGLSDGLLFYLDREQLKLCALGAVNADCHERQLTL